MRSLVRRQRETVKAVDGVSFEIQPGERVGFLGPNGAGKTTTLKVLSGLLFPTSGEVRVDGHLPSQRSAEFLRSITLVMGQRQQLLWDLPPAETFELNRALYEIPRARYQETLAELDALLDLGRLAGTPTRQLSLGERMKCELAASLLHRPKILFLDEPTIGLDVTMQSALRGFIRDYNQRFGATVLLTSHYMEDVQALTPRVIVIDHGRLRYDGDLHRLSQSIRPEKRVSLRLNARVGSAELERFGKVVRFGDGQAVLDLPQPEFRSRLAALLDALPIDDLTVEDPPLEEVMQDLFAQGQAERSGAPDGA
jgi:ABC-2 type transport system ATP-binding protein